MSAAAPGAASAASSSGAGSSSDLTRTSAADLAAHLAAGEVSSLEVTRAHLDRIAAVDDDVHAFLHINAAALETAAQVDAAIAGPATATAAPATKASVAVATTVIR